MIADVRLNYPLASGETGIAGFNVFQGVNLTVPLSGLGAAAPSPAPMAPAAPLLAKFYDIFVRGWVLRDQKANALDFDAEHPGRWTSRMSALSAIMHTAEPDLAGFSGHGGKLILVHGDDDALIPVGWSEDYYRSVVARMGAGTVNGFVWFYTVPGYGHGAGTFVVDWDSLSALDRWVETGAAPAEPIAADANPAGAGRTRPLCRFPSWPRYKGAGDINQAASFACAKG